MRLKTAAETRHQSLCCLHCLAEFNYLSVSDMLLVFPPSVHSHDLVSDTGLCAIVYLNKLDSLTADREIDWAQSRAE